MNNSTLSYEQTAQIVFDLLVENFSRTFYVGGMVRDLLLGKKIVDVDIATSAKPLQVVKLLSKHNFKLNLQGQKFGVVGVVTPKGDIEITTLRKETYSTSRFPKVSFTSKVEVDAQRRDFTINSLYFNPNLNFLYDPFTGLADLQSKHIRIIGKPEKKIQQDPLRIIRAIRFAKDLRFKLDPHTEHAIEQNQHLLFKLSKDKIEAEIKKAKLKSTKVFLKNFLKKVLHK